MYSWFYTIRVYLVGHVVALHERVKLNLLAKTLKFTV